MIDLIEAKPVGDSPITLDYSSSKVIVVGAACEMGRETFRSLSQWEEIELVAAVDSTDIGKNMRDLVGGRSANIKIEEKLGPVLDRMEADVLLDFSRSAAALQHGVSAIKRGIAPILGGVSLSGPDLRELTIASKEHNVPALVVPFFSLGAVLLSHLCERAAQWMSDAEIIDTQPEHKQDQPHRYAKAFAEAIAEGLENRKIHPHGWVKDQTKTWNDVPMHKVRLKGSEPTQEVFFGSAGETFKFQYEWKDPSAILEGLKLALSSIRSLKGVTVGLDRLIFAKK